MKRLVVASVLLCVAAVLAHAQSATSLIVRGRVVSNETGEPLPHARVVIYNDAMPLPAIFTDARGRFASGPLPESRYRLSATKAGYAVTSVARLGAATPDGVEVRMPRSSAIGGRVLDPFGEPVIGFAVSVSQPNAAGTASTVVKTASTDDQGEYRIGGLAAGTYVAEVNSLSIDDSGAVIRSLTYYPGVNAVPEAQRIVLQPGDQKTGVDFTGVTSTVGGFAISAQLITGPNIRIFAGNPAGTLAAAAQPTVAPGTSVIRGRITRADGLALAHATVTIAAPQVFLGRRFTPATAPRSAQTDDDGGYEFLDLPAGSYLVNAAKPGYTSTRYGQKTETDPGAQIDLADGQTRARLDIVLPRYSTLTGHILDDFGDPIEDVTVNASQLKFQSGRRRLVGVNGVAEQITDDTGRYRIFGLEPGQYIVTAAVGQISTLISDTDISGFAPTYFPGTTDAGEARAVTVARSQDVTGLDLTLVPLPTARVSGKKLASDGAPLGGSLILMPSQRSGAIVTPPTGARIEDDGRFEFPNVAPGEYVIQADHGRSTPSAEGEFVSQFVTVNGADVAGLELRATPGSTIRGHVTFDGDGVPPTRGLTIVPARADADRAPLAGGSIARAAVQPDLTFELTGIHGPRRLTLDRPPAGWMLKSVFARGVDVTDMPLPFGTPDQSLEDVQVVVTSQVTELSGTVTDSRGQAAMAYTLLVFPSDRSQWYAGSRSFRRVTPQAGGHFTVRGLPSSDYFVAPVAGMPVLTDGDDAWQDPEFLDTIALQAARATLTDGQKLSISARLITP